MVDRSSNAPVIVWFRQDLRLFDNPALITAAAMGRPVLPLFILDDANAGAWKWGAASRVWLHHSLIALNKSLQNKMVFRTGDARVILPALMAEVGATTLYWNRCYDPASIARDKQIKTDMTANGFVAESFNANLMYEPWTITKDDGTPYRVFTPFWRKGCANKGAPPPAQNAPDHIDLFDHTAKGQIDDLALLPTRPRWDTPMMKHWTPGEAGAQERFTTFLNSGLQGYKEDRNRPDLTKVSRLSPHLHWGEISPRQIYHTVMAKMAANPALEKDADHFLSELGWREFSHHLLFHTPTLPEQPLQEKFTAFPWVSDDKALLAWQRGMTGYPIIDAGMRELWQTGYMHNRVRMIVGSFLVKNMLTHWRHGEDWFWDTLFDADLPNNAASWQWIAGCGADAAPYFRIFNPVLQGEKFDPNGVYVRTYVPEIAGLPDSHIHQPWAAPPLMLASAGVKLGQTYPNPLMDHGMARDRALAALASIKG